MFDGEGKGLTLRPILLKYSFISTIVVCLRDELLTFKTYNYTAKLHCIFIFSLK